MAFKAYHPPAPATQDWTDQLSTKVLPMAGTVAGGIIGGIYGGGPAGAIAGASLGNSAGTALGGLISNKQGSQLQTQSGISSGIEAANKFPWRKDLGTPQTAGQQAAAGVSGTPIAGTPAPDEEEKIKSFYASRMA